MVKKLWAIFSQTQNQARAPGIVVHGLHTKHRSWSITLGRTEYIFFLFSFLLQWKVLKYLTYIYVICFYSITMTIKNIWLPENIQFHSRNILINLISQIIWAHMWIMLQYDCDPRALDIMELMFMTRRSFKLILCALLHKSPCLLLFIIDVTYLSITRTASSTRTLLTLFNKKTQSLMSDSRFHWLCQIIPVNIQASGRVVLTDDRVRCVLNCPGQKHASHSSVLRTILSSFLFLLVSRQPLLVLLCRPILSLSWHCTQTYTP